ncbi:fimbrial protein [Serratia fonticola]|uniref:fimbrial protein n=1 Tax=Serratia fonticola TaxID=47917 RepID=UPI002DBA5913|nr:fimbrial protein [Serratia fonticola]MEB7884613.1 type 1 fimbrial protein [Serratia fonticola]
MKLNKFLVAAATLGLAANAFAGNVVSQGGGIIDFKGSIIVAPCSVDEKQTTKEVTFDQVSDSLLADGGQSAAKDIRIVLTGCNTEVKSNVRTTFGGTESRYNPELLGITGNAEGASIVLVHGSGERLKLGVPAPLVGLENGTNVLKFSTYLLGDTAANIKSGDFTSAATWSLAYE